MTRYNAPLVSVIMSVYNGERFLREAIESILEQSYKAFEFIIIDDGSTDKSSKIISSYKDPRIKYKYQKNRGLVPSLNRAVDLASGIFIARMDADDISMPMRLEHELEWIMQSNNRGLVSTYFAYIDHETSAPNGHITLFPTEHTDLLRTLRVTNPFAHGAAMFRKCAILEVGGYKEDYWPAEDYDLWRRIGERYETGLVPHTDYLYRINNPNSISATRQDIQQKMVLKIQDELWNTVLPTNKISEIRRGLLNLKYSAPYDYRYKLESEYKSLQYTLAKQLLLRGKLHGLFQQVVGVICIMPITSISLYKYIPLFIKVITRKSLARLNRKSI